MARRSTDNAIAQLPFSVLSCWCYSCCCCCFFAIIGVVTAGDGACNTGTLQDECVSASDGNEVTAQYPKELSSCNMLRTVPVAIPVVGNNASRLTRRCCCTSVGATKTGISTVQTTTFSFTNLCQRCLHTVLRCRFVCWLGVLLL